MGKRGKPLEIREENDSIKFLIVVAGEDKRASVRIILRCERDGGLFASIEGRPWIHSAS